MSMGRFGKLGIWLQPCMLWAALLWLAAGLAHADAPPTTNFPNTGAYTARLTGARNNVAIVELTGDYARNLAAGGFNVEPRTLVAKEFYKSFADRYDFIVVFSNFEFSTGDATAFYAGVKNDTRGLGLDLFNNAAQFGSQSGALQGYIDMAALTRYQLDPADPRFENVMRVLSHEMLHRWAARVRFQDATGQPSGSLLGRDGSHWSFLLDTGGSVEYGNRWADNGDGTFTSRPDRQFFSPLDLYLMGMLKKEEVPPFFYIDSPGVDVTRLAESGVTVTGARRDVSIDQIIAVEGARQPSAEQAQKEFRLGFVLLTRPGVAVSDSDVQKVDAVRQAFQTRLAALTGGRALAHVHLETRTAAAANDPTLGGPVLGAPGSTANVLSALTWLRGKQLAEGPWNDNPLTRLRDTVVATSALAQVGGTGAANVDRALVWLGTQQVTNTDYVARRIAALAGSATEADWAQLAAAQNSDGGWGVAPGYRSTPLDTALAAITLAQDPNSTRQAAARERAKTFLLSKQNADGGWSHAVSGASRTATTAQVIRALASLGVTNEVALAAQFLAGRQNTDGGFGDSPSTTHDTSNVMLSLAAAGQLNAVRVADGFRFLNATQLPDGSWDGSVYATGLAIRTLGTAQTFNWTASTFTAQPAAVRDGQRVALSLSISNSGTVAAPPTTVKIFDGDPAGGLALLELPVPALAPGAVAVVNGSWNTFGQVGNHLLTALVDPTAAATEMTRADNTATVRVAVAPAPAGVDMTVTTADVQVMPGSINRLPTAVSVLAQVSNLGLTDVIGARVRLFAGPVGGSQVLVDEKLVNLLGRSTVPVSTSFQVTLPGRQMLSVVIDATAPDVDPTNNRADLFIETTSTFDPAVTPADLVVPATPVIAGADIQLKATIHNNGTADSPPFLAVLTVSDGTTVREIDRITVQLPAGGSKTYTLPWRVDLTGTLNFKVVLDPSNAVVDLDRGNNEATAAFTATPPPAGPNLAVSFRDFLIQPDPANEGRPLTLKATIRNTGTVAASNIEVGFYEGDPATGGTLLAPLQTLPSLAAGASVQVSADMANVVGNAQRLYFVAVDPAARITETSKDDNSAFRVIDVAAMPDLAVSAGAFTLVPVAPKPGDVLTVKVDVQNLGGQPAGPVNVRLLNGAGVVGNQPITSIAAQAKGTATFSFTLPAQAAADTLTVQVDPDNLLQDSNRANNTATRALVVQSGTAFVGEPYFSPNGDGVKDATSFGFRVEAASVVRIRVADADGNVVRSFAMGATPLAEGAITWDGRDDDGRITKDGTYRFRAEAADGTVLAQASVVLDTNRTPILRASGTESEYYRNLSCRATSVYGWTTTQDEQSLFLFSPVASNYPGLQGLLKVALQGGETTTVVPTSFIANAANAYLENLTASARGEVVAFSRTFYVNSTYTNEIWAVGGDGTGLRRLSLVSGTGVPAANSGTLQQLIATHDGQALIAHVYGTADGDQVRRITVGNGQSSVLFRSSEHAAVQIQEMVVAPNRRRALMRVYNPDGGRNEYAVLDFETGQFIAAPAGLYPNLGYDSHGKWSPDSSRFVLWGTVQTMGVEQGNNADFEFDVFDADFNLSKRFRTDNGPGQASWYAGTVDGPEWSSASDEFVFGFNPQPFWYGGGTITGDVASLSTIGGGGSGTTPKRFFRAHVVQGTLTEVPVDYSQIGFNNSNGSLWWGPNDRLAATMLQNYPQRHDAIHVDTGALTELFPNWWRAETNPNNYAMSLADFSPSGRRLYFNSYRDGANQQSACYSQANAFQLFAYESLQNLVADLQPLRDPRVGGILLRGTASDVNFAGYRLDYAKTTSPNDWHAVTVPGTEQKIGANLATWVPPAYGSYFVRLSVDDRAGNTAVALRRVSWSDTPPITDLVKNLDYISPNGDGVQDTLRLTYKVLEPVHLAFEVRSEDGNRVRLVERDHAVIGSDFAFEWDGRDDQGRQAPDGKYTLRVLDYEFAFEVDTTFPELSLSSGAHAFNFSSSGAWGIDFAAEALTGAAVSSVNFTVAPGAYADVRIADTLGNVMATASFNSGSFEVVWNGRSALTAADSAQAGPEYPAGTYLLAFSGGPDPVDVATFAVELSRNAGVVSTVVRPVLLPAPGLGGIGAVPFSMLAQDKLLDFDSVQLEFGFGDPPASWQFGYRKQLSQSVPAGWVFNGASGETPDGVPTAAVSGSRRSLAYSGSRLRATAQDKAGNAVSLVSPYTVVRELVLDSGAASFWAEGDPATERSRGIVATTNFSNGALPALVLLASPPPPPPPDYVMGALTLSYQDNLAVPATRVELRYAFLPRPVNTGNTPPEQLVLVPPVPADMALLNWKTVPLRGLLPTETSAGISQLVDGANSIGFRWQLPHHDNGLWLYQLVTRDASGQELRSNVHWTTYVRQGPPTPQPLPWQAYHEPAQSCDVAPTEVAHVAMPIPQEDPAAGQVLVLGQRLYHLLPGGARELMLETAFSNATGGVDFATSFSTASWAVGRHDFQIEIQVRGGFWVVAANPYIYVNHVAPQAAIGSPQNGQQMCAARIPVPGFGTVGYVPLSISITEPYAVVTGTQRLKAGSWVQSGPIGESRMAACSLPNGCGYTGPIIWPGKPGTFNPPLSARVYGLAPDDGTRLNPDPLDGTVDARLHTYGVSGHLVCTPVSVEVDGRVDAGTSIDRVLFSPNGDGQFDDETLTLSANESLTVKVEIVRATVLQNGTLVAGDVVATLASNLSVGNGDRLFPWDGRNAGGQVVADGVYAFRVTMTDGCGNERIDLLRAEVDNTPPAINIDSPRSGAAVPIEFTVKGSVTDLHPLRYEVFGVANSSPDALYALPSLAGMGQLHVDLARWNTAGLTGGAKIIVRAFDTVGNVNEVQLPIQLTEPIDIITSLNAAPDPFSPNGDGRRDRISILYTLARAANLTLDLVRPATGTKIKTLLLNVPTVAGNGAVVWDGRNTAGTIEPDEDVAVVLTAEVLVNGDVTARQTERTGFTLDQTPPVITFSQPRGPVTAGRAGVVARAVDPLFTEANLAVSINGGSYLPLADAQDASGTMTAPLDDVPEGPITLRVKAADRAENQATGTLSVIIDRTPPKVSISAPVANAYISGRRQRFAIEGAIEELHLARYQLSLGSTTLLEGTTLPTVARLLDWDPLTAADGPTTLTLKADDLAELSGTVSVPITVDNTPPVALIKSGGTPMYLRVGTVLKGTATDTNFASYKLELAPGGITSTRWTEVARGTAEVNDNTLTTFGALPVDGVYGLRLTVVDKAGNESVALQEVIVDTTAPQAVTLTATLQNRRDANVQWNAASEADVAGYILLRNGSRVNATLLATNSYVDVGLAAGTYRYTVKAVDKAGNESEPSNEGRVTVSTSEPVAQIFAPTNDAWAAGIADVRGTAASPADFKEYRLYVGQGPAPATWQLLRRSPLPITADTLAAWNTVSLTEGAQYTLKLEAEDLSGVVATDRVTVKVKNTPPRAPLQLQGTLAVNNIALSWTANTEPDIQGYLLYRDQRIVNSTGLVIGSLVPYLIKTTNYNDLAVPDGTHRYFVQAMDMAGNISDPSNEVEFKVDTRPPHVTVTKPIDGSKISQTAVLVGESPDSDLKTVQYQYRPEGNGGWTDIGAPLTSNSGPWTIEWNVAALPYGRYQVRAVGTDDGGKIDPNPGYITLVLTDLRKPDAATTLAARVTAGDVALTWVASPSSYATGYHVDRSDLYGTVTRLTTAPLAALTYTDRNLADATYTYRVVAVSAGGTESDASNSAVGVVYTPAFDQPYTPSADLGVPLAGQTQPAVHVVVRTQAGAEVAQMLSDAATGAYSIASVPLTLGDNRFEVVAHDDLGNTSKTATWHAVRGIAPAAPTGLQTTVAGHDVTLTWAANTEPDLAGYAIALSGVLRTVPIQPTQAVASSEYPFGYGNASYAIDGNPNTAWQQHYNFPANGQWLEVRLSTPRLLSGTTLRWESGGQPYRARIEGYDGQVWVPLAQLENPNFETLQDVNFARPYRTDRMRVLVQIATQGYVRLQEITLRGHDVQTQRSALFAGLPDGYANVGVVATSALGLISPLSEARPAVGDVLPPGAPVLQAVAQASDAVLSWTGPNDGDVAGFQVWRDGVLIATLSNPALRTYTDSGLPNAHYDYVVKALDTVGNAGAASNTAGVDIAVAGPAAPITAQASAPASGGVVIVDWTVGAGPQPVAFQLFRHAEGSTSFELLVSGLASGPYSDSSVQNGVRYFYLVKGVDSLGNVGTTSNEVNALPLDRAPPGTPYFVQPGRAPGPVSTTDATTTLAGYADPGATVVITKSDIRLAEVVASTYPELRYINTRGNSVFDLSADGLLLFGNFGNNVAVQTFDGVPITSRTLASDNNLSSFRFAPNGQSAAFTHYDSTRFRSTLMRWNRADDTVSLVSALGEQGTLGFSPDGRTLLSRGYDMDQGTAGLLIVDWASGSTRFIAGDFNDAAWAPDGSSIAISTNTSLKLIDPAQQRPDVTLPTLTWPSNLSWLPDGSALVVEYQGVSGNRALARIGIADNSLQTLVDSPSQSYIWPAVSPDGDAYAVYSNGGLLRRSFSGEEQVISPQASYYYWAPIWSKAGSIGFSYYGSANLYVPAGRFTLPDTALDVGANLFGAFSSDGSGNTSAPAVPLEVRRLADNLPDWQVGADSWMVFPATPQVGEATSIVLTVKNLGAAGPAVPLNVVAVDAQGAVTSLFSGNLGALAAGASQTVRMPWTAGAAGRWTLTALVDPAATLAEVSRDNNRSTRELFVTTANARPELQVTTSQPRYAGGSTVSASVVALSPGAAFDGSVLTRIVDAQGFELHRFDVRAVNGLVFGQPLTLSYSWPSGSTLAGDYRVVADLRGTDGAVVTNAGAPFAIDAGVVLASSLVTDRTAYVIGDTVNLRGTLRYVSGNVASFAAPAALVVRNANGDVVTTRSLDLQGLLVGTEVQVDLAMPATQVGVYSATLTAGPVATPLTQADAGFEVGAPTLPLIVGQLRLVGDVFGTTEPIAGTATLSNNGAPLSPLAVRVRAVHLGGAALATWTGELLDLDANAQSRPLVLTGTWPLGSFDVRLEALLNGSWALLDRVRVQAAERTPPGVAFTAPAAGAVVRSSALVTVQTTVQQAPVAKVELNVGGTAWLPMQAQGAGSGIYFSNALPTMDGPVLLQARATDTLSNTSGVVTLPLIIDNTPPLITITGVSDQQLGRVAVTPVVTVTDANPLSQTVLLDGAPFVAGTAVGEGVHVLTVEAIDKADNRSTATVRFTVDLTAPVVTRVSPASGLVTRQMPAVQATASDALSGVASVQLRAADGQWLAMPSNAQGYGLTPPPAADGDHVLALRATDLAGNVSAAAEFTVTLDTVAPLITVTGVVQGGRYSGTATPVVTVTDLHLATSSVLLDGAPYVSGTPVTANGSHTLSVSATDAAGNQSQQSLSFQVDAAVSLGGSLGISPSQVLIGNTAVLDARVTNTGSNDLGTVQVTLTLRNRATGAVVQVFNDSTTLAAGASYQHAWSWLAAGAPGTFIDAELVATAGGVNVPVAQGTLQLAAPAVTLDLAQQLAGVKKTLVYVRCTKLEDEVWDNCATVSRAYSNAATVAACTVDRAGWLDQYLTTQGVAHTVVTDEAAFLRELRSGAYSTYWLGGGALKLGSLAASEVQAAVQRGDTLLTEGWTAGRNIALEPVTGVTFLGKWSSSTAQLIVGGAALPAVTLSVNVPVRVNTVNGIRQATINNGHGIVSANYGRGRSLVFAFDLSGTLRAATAPVLASWNTLLSAGYGLLERTAPLEVVAGGRFNLLADVRNSGSAALTFDFSFKAPAQAVSIATVPVATASGIEGGLPTVRWRATDAAGETKSFIGMWRAPTLAGDYVLSGLVSQLNADGSSTLVQNQQLTLKVSGPSSLVQDAIDVTQALSLAEPGASAKTQTLRWLSLARMAVADARWDDALRQLAAAQAALQPASTADADGARLAIARAIEAVEKKL